jgi:hypothetical protein
MIANIRRRLQTEIEERLIRLRSIVSNVVSKLQTEGASSFLSVVFLNKPVPEITIDNSFAVFNTLNEAINQHLEEVIRVFIYFCLFVCAGNNNR